MSANRLRIAFSLMAAIVVALSPCVIGRGQDTPPPVADPAAAAAALDISAITTSPDATTAASRLAPAADPLMIDPETPIDPTVDAEAPAVAAAPGAETPADASEAPTDPAAETPDAPKLTAKMLLIETDWEKANDRDAASRLARSTSQQVFDLNQAGDDLFRAGYASIFMRDEARRIADEMQRLGLVRGTLSAKPIDLDLPDESVEALGGVEVSFAEQGPDDERRSVTWNLLVLAKELPDEVRIDDASGGTVEGRLYRAAVLGWKKRELSAEDPGKDAPVAEEERYVGSFSLRSDLSAVVPLALPGVKGLTVVVSPTQKGSAVHSLGPSGGQLTQYPLSADLPIDWDELVRAYEASPIGQESVSAAPVVDETATSKDANVTVHWRPASEDQFDLVEKAVLQRYPQVRILSRQFQGPQGASFTLAAPAEAAQTIHLIVQAKLPDATVQVSVRQGPVAGQDATESAEEKVAEITLFWRPAQEEQVDVLANALKQRFPNVEIGLKQIQGAQGATLVITAPASSAEAIQTLAEQTLPEGATVQVGVSKGAAEERATERTTLVFHLKYASSDEAAKLLDAMKLDPEIRIVSDARTNSIFLSAPDATRYEHVLSVIELLTKELDQPVEAEPAAATNAARPQPDGTANVAKLRSELTRIEDDVKAAAANARAASAPKRTTKIDDLRQIVAQAFRLRLNLQREEAAELRDRLAKIEENLARRERIEGAIIERRIEVLLDPALEWPAVADNESSTPPAVVASSSGIDATGMPATVSTDGGQNGADVPDRGDAFAAATSLGTEIADLTEQAKSMPSDDPNAAQRLATMRRRIDLLRQEFDGRQQAIKIDLDAAQAKLEVAEANVEMAQALYRSARGSMIEVGRAEAELKTAEAEVARLVGLLQQYDRIRASLPEYDPAVSKNGASTATAGNDGAGDPAFARPGDALSAATSLAREIADLSEQARSIVVAGSPDGSEVRLALIRRQIALLQQEFDARQEALRLELGALKAKLEGVQVRYERTRTLIDSGVVSQEEGRLIESELAAAQSEVARQEVLLQQYDRARASLPDIDGVAPEESSGSPSVEPPAENATTTGQDDSSADDAAGGRRLASPGDAFSAATALATKIGRLTSEKQVLQRQGASDTSPLVANIDRELGLLRLEFEARNQALKMELGTLKSKLAGVRMRYDQTRKLIDSGVVSNEEGQLVEAEMNAAQAEVARQEVLLQQYDKARESLPGEGEIEPLDSSQPQSGGAAIRPASRSATDASSFGTVKPSPFDKVPAELLGTWRLTRRVAADGSASKSIPATWAFDEETLLVRKSGAEDVRYWLELASATPKAFRTLRIVSDENGVGYGFRCKYEIEGDSLRVVGCPDADGNLIPEKVAAAPNVDYYEFERVRDAASTSSATDDAATGR